jgi:hypothetical protein
VLGTEIDSPSASSVNVVKPAGVSLEDDFDADDDEEDDDDFDEDDFELDDAALDVDAFCLFPSLRVARNATAAMIATAASAMPMIGPRPRPLFAGGPPGGGIVEYGDGDIGGYGCADVGWYGGAGGGEMRGGPVGITGATGCVGATGSTAPTA